LQIPGHYNRWNEYFNSYSKLSISILFTVALSTEFLSIAFTQRAYAFSIDFSRFLRFARDEGPRIKLSQGSQGR